MALLFTGLERIEGFQFPDNWEIITHYFYCKNFYLKNDLVEFLCDVHKSRAEGNVRRSKLLKDKKIVSIAIEENPHYLSPDELKRLWDEEKYIGEEFERTMKFPNGYVAKIEYWNSILEQEPNLGIYRSKYRRMILFDENNEIIVDTIQKNPDFGKTPYNKTGLENYLNSGIL